jgi:hypothetical protein
LSDRDFPDYVALQPILPYSWRGRLGWEGEEARKAAIERAFREFYDQWSGQLVMLANSKDARERRMGLALIGLEYEQLCPIMAGERVGVDPCDGW